MAAFWRVRDRIHDTFCGLEDSCHSACFFVETMESSAIRSYIE